MEIRFKPGLDPDIIREVLANGIQGYEITFGTRTGTASFSGVIAQTPDSENFVWRDPHLVNQITGKNDFWIPLKYVTWIEVTG